MKAGRLWGAAVFLPTQEENVNTELEALFKGDQDDRRGAAHFPAEQLLKLQARDEKRKERVSEITRQGGLQSAENYYHAAIILQHGAKPEDYLVAHILATIGVFKVREEDKWLSAATLDRFLRSMGRSQIFGTQYKRTIEDTSVTQDPYDRSLNDLFRKEYGLPSLAEQERTLVDLNRKATSTES